MDFTFKTYENLLNPLLSRGFSFYTYAQYNEAKFHTERSRSASNFTNGEVEVQQITKSLESVKFKKFKNSIPNRRASSSDSKINPYYKFQSLESFESLNLIILRHDVEAHYPNALKMAQIERKLGIKGSYYFRIFPKAGNEAIIKQIAALGHEIGYHYDDFTLYNGNHEKAILRFQKNLAYLRQFGPVTTITMEGAPLSKYDNRDLWEKREMRGER